METATIVCKHAKETVTLWVTGDWHLGHQRHLADLFRRHFQAAVTRRYPTIHVGDGVENVIPASGVARKGGLAEQALPPEEQRLLLIQHLQQLARVVYLRGNHERRDDVVTGKDFVAMVSALAGRHVTALRTPGIVTVQAGRQTYRFYVHHGEGPTVNPYTLLDRIQRDTDGLDGILAGHIHTGAVQMAQKITPDGPRTILRLRVGHYLAVPEYALERPVAPVGAPGSWLLHLDCRAHRVRPEWCGT
jgi:hypothetical protein